MSLQTVPDIPLSITVASPDPSAPPLVSSERRVTPSWTIAQLKVKLEPITGIPASSQLLRTKALDGTSIAIGGVGGVDEEAALVGDTRWGLRKGGEIEVQDSRPPAARQNYTDTSAVEKYVMPETEYEQLNDSVLAWKRRQKLGRFDPHAKSAEEMASERRVKDMREIEMKGVEVGQRCRIGQDDGRRGVVKFVGEIEGLGGEREAGCVWVGAELDEPVGKNDGSVQVETAEGKERRRIWEGRDKFGVLARPEKVEVGEQWGVLDDLMDEDMEEI